MKPALIAAAALLAAATSADARCYCYSDNFIGPDVTAIIGRLAAVASGRYALPPPPGTAYYAPPPRYAAPAPSVAQRQAPVSPEMAELARQAEQQFCTEHRDAKFCALREEYLQDR